MTIPNGHKKLTQNKEMQVNEMKMMNELNERR